MAAFPAPKRDFSRFSFESYTDESMLDDIRRLVQADLSEPYSVWVYRYFIHGWPEHCTCVRRGAKSRGRVQREARDDRLKKGYIAMLAVNKAYRGHGLGMELAQRGIRSMVSAGCTEIMLEAEYNNKAALALYDRLGFTRDERLGRYYLNGSDAFRLKLWIGDGMGDAIDGMEERS
eukprot:GSChrysophyteH2.ASY1.ANO1.1418.1 assembled CDS